MALTGPQQGRLAQLITKDLRDRGASSVEEAALLFVDFIERPRSQQKSYITALISAAQAHNTSRIATFPAAVAAKQTKLTAENADLTLLDTEIDNLT